MPNDRVIKDGKRAITVFIPIPLVNALDRLRYDRPYRSRSMVVAEAIERYLVERGEHPRSQ